MSWHEETGFERVSVRPLCAANVPQVCTMTSDCFRDCQLPDSLVSSPVDCSKSAKRGRHSLPCSWKLPYQRQLLFLYVIDGSRGTTLNLECDIGAWCSSRPLRKRLITEMFDMCSHWDETTVFTVHMHSSLNLLHILQFTEFISTDTFSYT